MRAQVCAQDLRLLLSRPLWASVLLPHFLGLRGSLAHGYGRDAKEMEATKQKSSAYI